MKSLTAIVFVLFVAPASAVICKMVDPEGGVSYSDVPATDCANQVSLPKPSRYAPVPSSTKAAPALVPPGTSSAPGAFAGYTAMKIEQPAQQATIRNNEGKVPVSVALSPTLQLGHQLRFLLDGVQIQPAFASQSVTLTGVERGRHTISAHVIDKAGRILRSAVPVSFHLRKASLLDPATGTAPPAPVDSSSSNFQAPAQTAPPFAATEAPNYSAPPAASANTPGRTNPAFAPQYQPQSQ